jgi:putative phosphoesterase
VLDSALRCTALAGRPIRSAALMARLALLSDVHGNAVALEAVRKEIRKQKPDAVLIAGDHALNGPQPAETVDALRELEADGALIVQGNTDIAVADFDYAAAFPWFPEGVPDSIIAAAEWAHETLGEERLVWLRGLPAERRLRVDDSLVLVTHASPGSQTQGFDATLDAATVVERLAHTDARVVCCGHTHLPDVRDFGYRVIVNDGSAGYVFDGEPSASWALVDMVDGGVTAEIRRTEFDVMGVANAISARGLPGDVYRAATVRTGKLVR